MCPRPCRSRNAPSAGCIAGRGGQNDSAISPSWNIAWAGSNEPGGDTDGPQHLAFGDGPHICAGVHLARIELRTAYQSWFEQVGPFRLAPDPAPSMGGGAIMHIDRLLLELDPV